MTEPKDTPEAKAVQARMAEAGVEKQSALHELHGKTVQIGLYRWIDRHGNPQEAAGGPATIFYAVGDRFMARMENGREPTGLIADLKPAGAGFTYEFPEGA